MNGKGKCKILKDIRRKIAEENDIAFMTSECKFQGECSGTCPKCEAEVRYLEGELRKRQMMGKSVAVAGVAAALVVMGTSGCALHTTAGDPMLDPSYTQEQLPSDATVDTAVDGEVYIPEDELMGDPVATQDSEPTVEVMGEVAVPEG